MIARFIKAGSKNYRPKHQRNFRISFSRKGGFVITAKFTASAWIDPATIPRDPDGKTNHKDWNKLGGHTFFRLFSPRPNQDAVLVGFRSGLERGTFEVCGYLNHSDTGFTTTDGIGTFRAGETVKIPVNYGKDGAHYFFDRPGQRPAKLGVVPIAGFAKLWGIRYNVGVTYGGNTATPKAHSLQASIENN
ncbi:hypothetical protein [Neolewinella antarctica]|uniref:Uncharacterized protein n=1 Tax=Neolewinella antarctica TaxID=442734 RepID=A0ABX0X6G4_9BACT|nr:hypothetical protein [Neolewinella antarctica]NJC24819.1 hypothetical protein [Neolewinella antarctica]